MYVNEVTVQVLDLDRKGRASGKCEKFAGCIITGYCRRYDDSDYCRRYG